MKLNIDTFLADPVNVFQRERYAYRLEDGTIIKFSQFNPNRGQIQSVGQLVRFMEADVYEHAGGFYETYKPIAPPDEDDVFKNLIQTGVYVYQGFVKEVIELTGEFDENTPDWVINLTLANEPLPASTITWCIKNTMELNRRLEEVERRLSHVSTFGYVPSERKGR